MGRSNPPAERQSYGQLQEMIRQKDKAVSDAFWNANTIKSIAWFGYLAHQSHHQDFTDENYAEAAAFTLKWISEQASLFHEALELAHGAPALAAHDGADMVADQP